MAKYDEIIKKLGRLRPRDFIGWLFPDLTEFENPTFEDREFEKLTHKRVDLLYKIKTEKRGEFYILLEFETSSSQNFPFRMLEYYSTIWAVLQKPIKPIGVFLNDTASIQSIPSEVDCSLGNETFLKFSYTKIILPQEDWKGLVEKGFPALYPLIPISKIPQTEEKEALEFVTEKLEKIEEKELRRELFGAFYLLAGYKYKELIHQIIGGKLMEDLMESATYREIFESGEEKARREDILKILKSRFKEGSFASIEKKIQSIKSNEKLDSLFDSTLAVSSLEEFETVLEAMINK